MVDYPRDYDPAREFRATRFVGAGHAIRRSTFEAVGGYDARLMFCGEELDKLRRQLIPLPVASRDSRG